MRRFSFQLTSTQCTVMYNAYTRHGTPTLPSFLICIRTVLVPVVGSKFYTRLDYGSASATSLI